jgi:hypothetical protein
VADRGRGRRLDVRTWSSERAALVVFVAYLVFGFAWLVRNGDGYWFSGDDSWGLFLRDVGGIGDLMAPQHQHWSTVPILVYHGLYSLIGVRSYLPYELIVIALRLTVAGLARAVMRRVGVGPWVATVAASMLVLFGAGGENYYLAVQVSMMGSMVCGLAWVLLADHEGGIGRRDWIGIGLGLIGLLSSGIGAVFLAVVGVATLLRRGWKVAAVHVVPLAVVYGAWYLHYRDLNLAEGGFGGPQGRAPLGTLANWIWWGLSGVFVSLGHFALVSILLAALLVGGLLLAWVPLYWREFRRRAAMIVGLLVGSVVLFAAVCNERFIFGVQFARAGRYLDIGAVFVLPALAVAADAVVRRWRVATPAVLVLLLVPIPFNIGDFPASTLPPPFFRSIEVNVVGTAESPLADQLPGDFQPAPESPRAPGVDMAFLRKAKADGKLPVLGDLTPDERGWVTLTLNVQQGTSGFGEPPPSCSVQSTPLPLTLAAGGSIRFDAPIALFALVDGQPAGKDVYDPQHGRKLTMRADDVPVIAVPVQPGSSYRVCPPGS